ncbi:MAG: S46 family peptidase [Bacteroidales bacterium]
MKKRITSLLIGIFVLTAFNLKADEGMWIPMFLEKYNIEEMQELGFSLSAEDIYSINNNSMKDAVMIFGGGCTGELISDQGLLITNHHCGYGNIQRHSSLENDYLTDGFWAMSKEEELTNPGLEVRFLEYMEDVTEKVLDGVTSEMSEKERQTTIDKNMDKIRTAAGEDNEYEISIKPFFHGNQFFLFANKVYKDVRLVGAPPSAIGKFGGDTDNWMWPRHTGDFSLFRIYTAPDGSPAEYSEENIPMKPEEHFPISIRGVEKGDFTMVFGYPGSTDTYAPSYELELVTETINPLRIGMRDRILDKMKAAMESDPLIRIQYASKAAGTSNGWKKWIGENRGLERMNAIERKKQSEQAFTQWARGSNYENILEQYETIYTELTPYKKVTTGIFEALNGIELVKLTSAARSLVRYSDEDASEEKIKALLENLESRSKSFYKDYDQATAKAITKVTLDYYMQSIDETFWPEIMEDIQKKGLDKTVDKMFDKSLFASEEKMNEFVEGYNGKTKKITKDPVYALYMDFVNMYMDELTPKTTKLETSLDSLDREYMAAWMKFKEDKALYPDANFTLRVGYGQVDDYSPRDAVEYKHYTTIEGIIEKDNPEIYDYDVPEKLKKLYREKDYGPYAAEDGTVHVCFTASNHTTGGNSGSPVVNSEGHMIGINFDRNWEGTMSDLMYDPDMCRNISLDMRYALFIIDRFAGAGHLVDEMTIIR